jgi:tellurite resistance protein
VLDDLLARFPAGDAGPMTVVDLAVLVAAADGEIDVAEMSAVEATIAAVTGQRLAAPVVGRLVTNSCAQIRARGAEACARTIGEALAARGAAEDGLRLALAVAMASNGLSAVERERIEQLARAAGVPAARVAELLGEPAPAAGAKPARKAKARRR